MSELQKVYVVQQGSSSTFRVSDEGAWYLLCETWEGARLLDTRLVSKHLTQADALDAKARAEGRAEASASPPHLKAAPGQTVWDCLAEAGVGYTRVGFWHEKPRDGEILVATVRVHPHDPDLPVFSRQ